MSFMHITLPSLCRTYDVGAQDIQVRPYRVKDETVLSQITLTNIEQKYLQVMRETVQGIDPLDLTIGNRTYIMLWEYINSYSPVDHLATTCSHCLKQVTAVVDLNKLEVDYLPEDFVDGQTLTIRDSENNDVDVKIRLITVRDEIETEKYAVNHKDALLYRFARTISYEGKSPREITAWLEEAPAISMARIRKWHDEHMHGPVMLTKYTCPECKQEEQILVPFRLEFIYPEGEALEDIV